MNWKLLVFSISFVVSAFPGKSSPVMEMVVEDMVYTRDVDPQGGTGGGPISGQLTVKIVSAGTSDPIPGAFVIAGSAPGNPVAGNYGFADSSGSFVVSDADLMGPIDVTSGADGYSYFTFFQVDASEVVIPLTPSVSSQTEYQIGDYVNGIDVDNGPYYSGDGYIDMAMIMPSLNIDMLASFDMSNLVGPLETIVIMGQEVQIPSNIFLPQQWETFVEIRKDHYYLYLPAGSYSLYAMSGRIPVDEMMQILQGGGDFVEILQYISWREADVLDIAVSSDTNSADLTVEADFVSTVTLHLENIPADTQAIGISAGDLDGLNGGGRIVPLGFNSLDCPPGLPCSGNLQLTALAAGGDFAGLGYIAGAAVQSNTTDDILAILDRQDHILPYTSNLISYFNLLNLQFFNTSFRWNDVENALTGSPAVGVTAGRIRDSVTDLVIWNFMTDGDLLVFQLPELPVTAPEGLSPGGQYRWEHTSIGLGYNPMPFDYNDFALMDIADHLSHVASDSADFSAPYPEATPTPTAPPGEPTYTPAPPTSTPVQSTPTPQPTSGCSDLGCQIYMPATDFTAGSLCYCDVMVCNPSPSSLGTCPVFVILDVAGVLFFAPDFSDFDYYPIEITSGEQTLEILPEFDWPAGAGSAQNVLWYAGITDPGMSQLIGDMDVFEFGWH